MKLYSLSQKLFLVFVVVAAIIIPGQAFASEASTIPLAKTAPPPPPREIAPATVFDPNYDYLEKGGGYISYQNKKANIWGETFGVKRADKIGVQLTMQRWTGSAWIDVYTGKNTEDSDSAYIYQSHNDLTVLSGYYYRTKSYHWVKVGSKIEDGTRYSSSVLIPE